MTGPDDIDSYVNRKDALETTTTIVTSSPKIRLNRASVAVHAGRGTTRTLLLLPDGRVLNERALAKVRALDVGHAYVEELLCSFGATARCGADPVIWLPRALREAGVRTLWHPGYHRYLFRLGDRHARRPIHVGYPDLPFPKLVDAIPAAGGCCPSESASHN